MWEVKWVEDKGVGMGTTHRQTYRNCTVTERDILYALRVESPQTGSDLTDAVGRSGVAVSRALQSLADKGLVARDPAEGIRGAAKHNRLTDDGKILTATVFQDFAEAL